MFSFRQDVFAYAGAASRGSNGSLFRFRLTRQGCAAHGERHASLSNPRAGELLARDVKVADCRLRRGEAGEQP